MNTSAEEAAAVEHDLVVVGGGIHGVMVAREAALRGLRPLLVERDDFGRATSRNSLRIIHGGLRYLQSFDLLRHWESVGEQHWFLRSFPGLVKPLPCLMPLYGEGLRRPSVMRMALVVNDCLSAARNARTADPRGRLPHGRLIGPRETRQLMPLAARDGLRGAALWWDAWMPNPRGILMAALRSACARGATAVRLVEAVALHADDGRVTGVIGRDREGRQHRFRAPAVVNAAGPWCRVLAERFGQDRAELFTPSLAWNVLFDRAPPCEHAVAIARPGGAHTYFLLPSRSKLLAGTGHAPWQGEVEGAAPSRAQLERFIDDLNAALPGIDLNRGRVLRVFSGLLPAAQAGTARLRARPAIVDHGRQGGPQGLWSVSGVKFTTSRSVAEKVVERMARARGTTRTQLVPARETSCSP